MLELDNYLVTWALEFRWLPWLIFGFLALASLVLGRVRTYLATDGILPSTAKIIHRIVWLASVTTFAVSVIGIFPSELIRLQLWIIVTAIALAFIWSMRLLFSDITAAIILWLGRSIRSGSRIEGPQFAGTVQRIGWRTTSLQRDSQTSQRTSDVLIPNRRLLSNWIGRDAVERIHEVKVCLTTPVNFDQKRKALRDAVLASPYIIPGTEPEVFHQAHDPTLWRIRARLVAEHVENLFDGDILERTEAILDRKPEPAELPASSEPKVVT